MPSRQLMYATNALLFHRSNTLIAEFVYAAGLGSSSGTDSETVASKP